MPRQQGVRRLFVVDSTEMKEAFSSDAVSLEFSYGTGCSGEIETLEYMGISCSLNWCLGHVFI